MGTVTYSIDVFRQQLSDELKTLRDIIKAIDEDEHFENYIIDLKQSFEHLACLSNGFNCVSANGFENFSEMGHVAVKHLD